MNRRFFLSLLLLPFLGAGCAAPFAGKKLNTPPAEPLCLAWSSQSGFRAWIETYGKGEEAAVQLAEYIRLPKEADKKLLEDLTVSLNAGGNPAFLCTMDAHGQHVVWVMERADTVSNTCTETFYVSINGNGTTSDFTTTGRAADCEKICKPKRLEETLLVWQCDLREGEGNTASWTQIQMDRATGASEIVACQEDELGKPSGCLR
jgi:hypothetical protein